VRGIVLKRKVEWDQMTRSYRLVDGSLSVGMLAGGFDGRGRAGGNRISYFTPSPTRGRSVIGGRGRARAFVTDAPNSYRGGRKVMGWGGVSSGGGQEGPAAGRPGELQRTLLEPMYELARLL